MLAELGLVEQRYAAVREVLYDGATVTDVARRYGVARQTVHEWLRRYAAGGLARLVDQSSRPASCPHQVPPQVEARIVELRRAHPGWGPRTIGHQLGREGFELVPAVVDLPVSGARAACSTPSVNGSSAPSTRTLMSWAYVGRSSCCSIEPRDRSYNPIEHRSSGAPCL